jgi:hypothetical protein
MSNRRIESFVIRVVVQDNEPMPTSDWHGRIQHITTGDECQFKQLQDLLFFMSTYMKETEGVVNLLNTQGDPLSQE